MEDKLRKLLESIDLSEPETSDHDHDCDNCPVKGDCFIEGAMRELQSRDEEVEPETPIEDTLDKLAGIFQLIGEVRDVFRKTEEAAKQYDFLVRKFVGLGDHESVRDLKYADLVPEIEEDTEGASLLTTRFLIEEGVPDMNLDDVLVVSTLLKAMFKWGFMLGTTRATDYEDTLDEDNL